VYEFFPKLVKHGFLKNIFSNAFLQKIVGLGQPELSLRKCWWKNFIRKKLLCEKPVAT